MPSDLSSPNYAAAISSVETRGAADPYTTLGPATKSGDRAHGKYQIMGANIGPWSQEVLGQSVSPEQFLANPQLQDAVFQGKFNQYVQKYGPEGAAKAWFAGEKGMNNPDAKDSLGTSVSGYGAKFMKALGAPEAPTVTQASAPVPVSSQGVPGYGAAPNNAPAGLPEGPQNPQPASEPQMAMAPPIGAPQLAPMVTAPRRPPDLRALHAFLQRSPVQPGFFFKG